MRIACWLPKATETHLEYVILYFFLLQRYLNERASMLLYTDMVCPVNIILIGYWVVTDHNESVKRPPETLA